MLKYSYAKGGEDFGSAHPVEASDLEGVYEFIKLGMEATPATIKKEDCNRLIVGDFKNEHRHSQEFNSIQLLGIDIDDIPSQELFFKDLDALEKEGIAYILYASPSHTEENPRYRLFLELDEPIEDYTIYRQNYESTVLSVLPHSHFKKELVPNTYGVDASCKEAMRLFFISNIEQLPNLIFSPGAPILSMPPSKEERKKIKAEENVITQAFRAANHFRRAEVANSLASVLEYLRKKELSITKDYTSWLNVAFATVSLQNNGFEKEECLEYFMEFSKLDSDSKIYSSQEDQEKQFEACWEGSRNEIAVNTIFFYARELGWTTPKSFGETVHLVQGGKDTRYHLVYPHEEGSRLIPVDPRALEWDVSQHEVINSHDGSYSLAHEDVTWEDEEKGVIKRISKGDFLTKNKVAYPTNTAFLLGEETEGMYYDRDSNTISMAKHHIMPTTPTFSEEVDSWIRQLPIEYKWFCSYLRWFADTSRALPMIQSYGQAKTGKSFLALCLGSVFSTPPDKNHFKKNGQFNAGAGSNPLLHMEEEICREPARLKDLITSDVTYVDQKFDGRNLLILGYHRLYVSVNQTFLDIPQADRSDFGAMSRRVQPMHFEDRHSEYLEALGGMGITKRWIDEGVFRDHVAYIRENPEEFGVIPPSNDVLVLKPLGFDTEEAKLTGGSVLSKAVIEYVVEEVITKDSTSKRKPKTISLDVDKAISNLLEKRKISRPISSSELLDFLVPVFGKLSFKRDKLSKKTLRLSVEEAKDASTALGLDVEEYDGEDGIPSVA